MQLEPLGELTLFNTASSQELLGRRSLGTCEAWNGKDCRRENLARILKYNCKIWYNFPNCGTRTSLGHEWWLAFPMGLWWVVVISCSFWMVVWVVALISWRLLGTMEMCMPSEQKMTPQKMALDLQTNVA